MIPIIIELERPEGDFPGRCEVGEYEVSGDMLEVFREDGTPIGRPHKLKPGENPHLIAGRLLRSSLNGIVRPFTRHIEYPDRGKI